jgi:O-acetyl-ADP-ribose deacetylase (regulator of RNase III)
MDADQQLQQSPLAKEQTLFSQSNDFINTLIYFELIDQTATSNSENELIINNNKLNEQLIKEKLITNELIQNIFILNGDKSLLISAKNEKFSNEIESLINDLFNKRLMRKEIPYSKNKPIFLVSELNDKQLSLIDNDKFNAIRFIEAKTGLKLKKIKKTIYFSGLLFQFILLDEILNEKSKSQKNDLIQIEKPKERHLSKEFTDWQTLYKQSEIKYNFKLKPKSFDSKSNLKAHSLISTTPFEDNKFEYDIYIFQADLTDLNTDALVNASNPDLHPGYDGDGISRRIREKGGKQMHDACKSIIKHDRNNQLLNDSEVVYTKSFGKLRSKYVLHSVAPTWTKYILSLESGPKQYEKFEPLLEQTFVNIFKIAHDQNKMKLNSIALPVSSSSSGGAFDVPIELWAHTLYTELVDFQLTSDHEISLKTVCITSIEPNTVKQLCDIFSNYFESYSESSWAMPLSPMNRLLQQAIENKPPPPPDTLISPKREEPPKQITILQRNHNPNKPVINDDSRINVTTTSKQRTISLNENSPTNSNHHQNNITLESSSSSTGSNRSIDSTNLMTINTENHNNTTKDLLYCCLFCQKESKTCQTMCGNQTCKASYCDYCIFKFLSKQNSKKCPSCHQEIDKDVLIRLNNMNNINNNNNRSSSSSSLSPTRLSTNTHHTNHHNNHYHNNNYNNNNNTNRKFNQNTINNHKAPSYRNYPNGQITDGKIYIRKIEDPCEGYENAKSLLITFEIPDGIQKVFVF